jgi:hypothetical protein
VVGVSAPVLPAASDVDGVLAGLVAGGLLHEADATVIGDAARHNGNRHAVYLGLERLAVIGDDDRFPMPEWWVLARAVAASLTVEQSARVLHAGADLALLRAEGIGALKHFELAPRADVWRAEMCARQDWISDVAGEVTSA